MTYTYDYDEETGEYFSRPANEFDGYDPQEDRTSDKYTLKMFMEDYEGFDFENGEIVLFDADLCRQYLLSSKAYKMVYLTEERLSKCVYDWKHSENVMTIIIKEELGQS